MTFKETAFTFTNQAQNALIGIIHQPDNCQSRVGLMIVVGGPQYRIGAHRQYIHLARHAAKEGIPAMRFDYQGIGDSDGTYPGFELVGPDIGKAIDAFLARCPEIDTVALWGLCEGASAILLGGIKHKAVSHIILANPWVRTDSGLAKAYVKHYYLDRLKSPEFWRKIVSGHLNVRSALTGFAANIRRAFGPKKAGAIVDTRPFPDRMLSGLQEFKGKSLLLMSGQDLVAREFDDLISSDRPWKDAVRDKISTRIDLAESDHTFSCEDWRQAAAKSTADWLLSGQ